MATPTDHSRQPLGSGGPDGSLELETSMDADGERTVLTVAGEVDVATVESFRHALLAAQRSHRVVVDLSAVTFMDSAGVNALVGAYHRVSGDDELRLVGLRPNVRRVFEITGLLELFGVEPSHGPEDP
jgi:anti-sigma B factor antagonist